MEKLPIQENSVPFQFQFPAGLRVLAVDNDHTILEIIRQMCDQCYYRSITFSNTPHALNYVMEKKGCVDVILVEVHMPNMNGYEFLQHVTKETNVPVIMMSLDYAPSSVMKAIINGACDYWIKPFHGKQFKIIWKHAAMNLAFSQNILPKKIEAEFSSSFVSDASVRDQNKINSNSKEFYHVDESDDCYPTPTKKPRLSWSTELHNKFVKAVMQIGPERAQPKNILEVMNVPGLTKDHISSHLQKYKLRLKKLTNIKSETSTEDWTQ